MHFVIHRNWISTKHTNTNSCSGKFFYSTVQRVTQYPKGRRLTEKYQSDKERSLRKNAVIQQLFATNYSADRHSCLVTALSWKKTMTANDAVHHMRSQLDPPGLENNDRVAFPQEYCDVKPTPPHIECPQIGFHSATWNTLTYAFV